LFVTDEGIEVRAGGGLTITEHTLSGAIDALLAALGPNGYVAMQAYLDRVHHPEFAALRDVVAARSKRPVTFGWGPRFLHSTGQFHKGGPAIGVFLQITAQYDGLHDLGIPGRPFTFGQFIQAQAAGDASVLADRGRPVLTLTLRDVAAGAAAISAAIG